MSAIRVSSERARAILETLIRSDQQLEANGSDADLLEANRLAIVYWQSQLRRALASERARSEAAA